MLWEKISIQVLVVQYSFLNNIQKCKTKSTKTVITILAKPDAHKSLYRSPDRTYIIGCVMVFNTTFNNISVILWPGGCRFYWCRKLECPENSRHAASHWRTLSHNAVSSTPRLSVVYIGMNTKSETHHIVLPSVFYLL